MRLDWVYEPILVADAKVRSSIKTFVRSCQSALVTAGMFMFFIMLCMAWT